MPNTVVSAGLVALALSTAPARPPAALVKPKRQRMARSRLRRRCQKRIAVPIKCGIATAATAVLVPARTATSGVSRLPMPKPATDAMAPDAIAVRRRTDSYMSLAIVGQWRPAHLERPE